MKYKIRRIKPDDNKQMETIIRTCLIEYGANHEGTAWADPDLCRLSDIYQSNLNGYWVAEDEHGRLVGGIGIGLVSKEKKICELQKLYCIKETRGTGVAQELLDCALEYAKIYYQFCYLETLDNMIAAQRFYEKNGFVRTNQPIMESEHFSCDVHYIKKIK